MSEPSNPGHEITGVAGANTSWPWGTILVIVAIIGLAVALFIPVPRTAREAQRRNQCMNGLKHIGLALATYEDSYGSLPPAYTVDSEGRRLHSWRTLILPYLPGGRELYEKIDFTKPWDDAANAEIRAAERLEYRCPSADCPANHCTYLAVVHPNGRFRGTEPSKLPGPGESAQDAILIDVPADQSVPWMAPFDADEQSVMGFGSKSNLSHPAVVNVAFADGSVRVLQAEMPADERRALISGLGADASGGGAAEK